MSNTITAFFKGRVGVAEAVYQNDYGIIMNFDSIELPAHFDCYFSVIGEDDAIPGVGADRQVVIPNTCLSKAGTVTLHIPLHTGANDSEVEYVVYFKVVGRARPADDGTPVQMSAIERALALLQAPLTNIEDIVNDALAFTGPTLKSLQEKDSAHDSQFMKQDVFISSLTGRADKAESDIDVLSERMDAFVHLAEGSTTGDAELIDGRVGADGVTYANIGTANRTQFTDLKRDIVDYSKGYYLTQLSETLAFYYFNAEQGSFTPLTKRLTYLGGFNTFGAKLLDVEITEGYEWNIYFANRSDGTYSLISQYSSTGWIAETRRMISVPQNANRIYIACIKSDGTDFTEEEKTNVFKIMLRGAEERDVIDYDEDTDMHTNYYGYYQYAAAAPSVNQYNRLTQDRLYKIGDYKIIGFDPKSGYDLVLNYFDSDLKRLGNNGAWISTRLMFNLTGLYPTAAYFKVTYRKSDNSVLNLSDYNAFETYRANIKSILPVPSKSNLKFVDAYNYNSGDLAVYGGNYFFAGGSEGLYVNGVQVSASTGHGNNIMFGKTLDGTFPRLYAGSWYQGEKKVYVNRVTLSSAELVKTIEYLDLPTGYLNMCVDEPNERVYIFMETGTDTYQGNILFAVGDFDGNIITTKPLGITIPIIQGMTFEDEICYMTSGNGSAEYPNYLWSFDTDGNLITKSKVELSGEIEGITITDDGTVYLKAIQSLYSV